MYKPAKVLTQFKFTHRKRKNRALLGDVISSANNNNDNALALLPSGIMAIGRLDEDSEGLLLLTTDGKISERVRRKSVGKEYYVQVNGQITQEAIERLQNGVGISLPRQQQQQGGDDNEDDVIDIGDSSSTSPPPSSNIYTTLPCKVRVLETAMVKVASSTETADDEAKRSMEEEPKKKKRRKKFSGTCNKCNQAGHKAKECSENPIDLSSLKHNTSTIGSNNVNDVEQHHYFMLLPKGIPPPAASTQHRLYNHHRLTSSTNNTAITTSSSWITITINEGKNRQVRRMTAAVGFPTIRLARVRIGCVTLDGMAPGEVRELKEDDIINI
ncbi:hypothetical protein ACHAWC_011156 [Mediolabrus comicus]